MKNNSTRTPDQTLFNKIVDIERQLNSLKTNQLGVIVVPIVAGDPTDLTNGQVWYNSVTGKFRKREGGTSKNWEGS